MIKFHQVTKKFGSGVLALDNVNLEINKGELAFIIGSSGAGKTTLLRLIIRDLLPSDGVVFINELNLMKMKSSQVHKLRRSVGTIFQDFKILPDKTAFENVALPLEIANYKPSKVKEAVSEILKRVKLIDKANHFPSQFSAGELQRLSLARAVVVNPEIILADEPTGNLDPETSWDILDLLKDFHRQGSTVLIATHDQDIVNSLEERVIRMEKGMVVRDEKSGKYL